MAKPPGRVLSLLEECPFFQSLDPATIYSIARIARQEWRPDGHILFTSGDAGDGLRLILDGSVRLWINDRDGRELTLAVLSAGEPLGEIAFCDGLPQPVNATIAGGAYLLFLNRTALQTILHDAPQLMQRLAVILSARLRQSIEAHRQGAFDTLRLRLGRALCEMADIQADLSQDRAFFARRIPQSELARHLGVTRESVNKQMRAIRADGQIALSHGRIVIDDLPAFRAAYQHQM